MIEGSAGYGVIVSHPTGNTFVRALLNGLNRSGKLQRFYTGFGYSKESPFRSIPDFMAWEFKRREYPLDSSQIVTHPGRDLLRILAGRLGIRSLIRHEKGWASVDAVYRMVDESLATSLVDERPSIVYAYEDGALSTFRKARQLGVSTCYELPIAYWETVRKIHEEEVERSPEWKVTFPALRDSEEKYDRKREEIRLADAIICPSRFVLDSIPDEIRNSRKCTVAEFGSPTDVPFIRRALPKPDQPVRFLFVGNMTQRKGLADLFAAFRSLQRKDIQLIVAGTPHCDLSFYRGFFSDFVYEPPRSHAEILRLMQTCHVFVLPSLVEGPCPCTTGGNGMRIAVANYTKCRR